MINIAVLMWYGLVSLVSLYVSYMLRFDNKIPGVYLAGIVWVIILFQSIQVTGLVFFGQLRSVLSYFSFVDFRTILFSNILSSAVLYGIASFFRLAIPRGVLILDFILFFGGLVFSRFCFRYFYEIRKDSSFRWANTDRVAIPVAIFGAGDVGARLARDLLSKPSLRLRPTVFFDDDPVNHGRQIHGVPIIGGPELIEKEPWCSAIRKLIVATPSASPGRLGEIARLASKLGIPSETLPSFDQLVEGTVKASQLRPVRIDDLLQRKQIKIDRVAIGAVIRNHIVVVTGAGGSIGSELCRQILSVGPRQLLLLERSESQLFQIEQELLNYGGQGLIVPLVVDIADSHRVRQVFEKYRPNVVFHAAAHKHVPMMESQPMEAIKNNAIGTANLAKMSLEYSVERFVFISTDKAINPTNVMGATKRLAEVFLQAFQAAHPNGTKFMAVRFGNVLGSSGSVVPTFQKQIAVGGPVTVTHPNVTRYFMTIPEAVGLVLQAGVLGEGGEIFVLDMGEPIKIVDLAKQMIELSGYRPGEDIEIRFVGLRPGEKMYEELSHDREKLVNTQHPKILRFVAEPVSLLNIENQFSCFEKCLDEVSPMKIKLMIKEIVPEYTPFNE